MSQNQSNTSQDESKKQQQQQSDGKEFIEVPRKDAPSEQPNPNQPQEKTEQAK